MDFIRELMIRMVKSGLTGAAVIQRLRTVKNLSWVAVAACLTLGCSHSRLRPTDGGSGKPGTLSEAVAPVSGDAFVLRPHDLTSDILEPFDLLWAEMLFSGAQWDRDPVFVTCHASRAGVGYVVRFYLYRGSRLEFVSDCQFGAGYLDRAVFIDGSHAFLLLSLNAGGSSASWDRHDFWLGEVYGADPRRVGIREVTIRCPVDVLRHLIGPKQHSDPSRVAIRCDGGRSLKFSFSIWNEGDFSNFPTGGAVEGDCRMVLGADGIPTEFSVGHWAWDEGGDG